MRSEWIFRVLAILVFGALFVSGFLFYDHDRTAFWIIEGIMLFAALFFIVLYFRLIKPYKILLSGIGLLGAQDFSSRLRHVPNAEANRLIDLFNRMITQLKNERLQVREKNQFLDLLMKASPQGVVILDFDERITEINPAGMELLQIRDIREVEGKKFSETSFDMAVSLASLKPGDDIVVRVSAMKVCRCIRSSFIDRGFDHPFILVEELTRELLKIEKASYENIIRMMSHEVNNSIGAIGSTLDVVAEVLAQNGADGAESGDVLAAVQASSRRSAHLASFISRLAEVVKIPPPSFSLVSLNNLGRTVEALTVIECRKRDIQLSLVLAPVDLFIRIDGIQMEQVLVNIVKNSYESIGSNGEIRIIIHSEPASITVEDNGPGIADDMKDKLFTPFFTTKSSGQGIGLMVVREVLMNHNASFRLQSGNGLTRFEIEFR